MKSVKEPTDVLVVGGGIVGVACAEACAAAGLGVRLIERDRIAGGTTAAGMGHVVAVPGALFALARYSQQLWRSRASEWAGSVSVRTAGTIWLAREEDDEQRQLDSLERALSAQKVATSRLERDELHRQEPALAPAVAEGLWVKDDLLVDPAAAARRLAAIAQARKVEIVEGVGVDAIVEEGVRLAEGTVVRAQHVVVAAGVDTSRLLPELGIFPRKGHIVHLATPNGYVHAQLGEVGYAAGGSASPREGIAFNVHPAASGGLWVGASRQIGVDSMEVEEGVIESLLKRAALFLADPSGFPVTRRWTGLRPASPDHRPFIGPWPGRPSVLVAAGHEGLGITTSLATGRLIADLLTGRTSEIDRTTFALDGRLGQTTTTPSAPDPPKS